MRHLLLTLAAVGTAALSLRAGDEEYVPNPAIQNVATNIVYGEHARCRLDVMWPKDETNACPVVVWFHGGGLVGGDKYFLPFTDTRIVQVAVRYPFLKRDGSVTADMLLDACAQSVDWTMKNVARYGGDSKRVFLSGHSAGGYITMMLGMDPSWLGRYGIRTTDLGGIVPLSGQSTDHFNVRKYSGDKDSTYLPKIGRYAPLAHVAEKDYPPMLVISGDPAAGEWKGRAEENELMVASIRACGHTEDVEYVRLPQMGHGDMRFPGYLYVQQFVQRYSARALKVNNPDRIACAGTYGGHLQGVATDGESIFWSFTVKLVKTDLRGRVLAAIDVPDHHGDLCVKDGTVYVAVNLGRFNFEKLGVSEVRAYAAKDLKPSGQWKLPECVHGAGGMTFAGDRFFVVGGLPATHESNYVYEFTSDFTFVKRHELKTGFTLMGIQTAAFEDGRFIFGIYGRTGAPAGSLECPRDLSSFVRRLGQGNVGIVKLDGSYWTGRTGTAKNGRQCGSLVRTPGYPAAELDATPRRTGKGAVKVFFEGCGSSGWQDSGYCLAPNGYRPLCNADPSLGIFFGKDRLDDPALVLPAVGIGGARSYSAADLVRAVRRVAETDEAFAVHATGTPETAKDDPKLAEALKALRDEAVRLGVRVAETLAYR